MYATLPSSLLPLRPVNSPSTIAVAALPVIGGTGSVFHLSRVSEWRKMFEARVPYFVIKMPETDVPRPDIRSAADHLANIRRIFNPAIADLATVFGVSRQAIYKWIGGESTPEPDKFERIRALGLAADTFQKAGVMRAGALLKMKAFEGQSLMDLVATDRLLPEHTRLLIAEAQAMQAAYARSGLAQSKAAPSDDWRAELSIPGSSE